MSPHPQIGVVGGMSRTSNIWSAFYEVVKHLILKVKRATTVGASKTHFENLYFMLVLIYLMSFLSIHHTVTVVQ